jgi:hypothetical protein
MKAATAAANVASPGETAAAAPADVRDVLDVRADVRDVAGDVLDVRDVAVEVRDVAVEVRDVAVEVRDVPAGVRGGPIAPVDGGISRAADPDASATPLPTAGRAGVTAAESGTGPGRRGVRDRVVRRSPGPSVGLMTRAYVSVIAYHAAQYRFMPKHQCFMRNV